MDPAVGVTPTTPAFADEALTLAKRAQHLSEADLQKLMKISAPLAKLNSERFRDFGQMDSKPAALAFAGDTYQGLEADSLSEDEMRYAQDHLRILSGLYGVLRPLDAIQPYRLEMGSRLKTDRGASLYAWWGSRISEALNTAAAASNSTALVNCASQEYFGAVDMAALDIPVITPVFIEERAGTAKIISFYAKKARGAMARYIVQNRVRDADALLDFDMGGYRFQPDRSEAGKPVFLRTETATAKMSA
jgi:hypothetical protein